MDSNQLESKLLRLQQEYDHFAYIVSHDLKAPLRAISNLTEWIADDITEGRTEDIHENLRLLKSRAGRADLLVNALLEFSRAGRLVSPSRDVDTAALARSVAAEVGIPAEKVDLLGEMPALWIEPEVADQIFRHLLKNAAIFGEAQKKGVQIMSEMRGDQVCFTVRDQGPGVEETAQAKVFDLFATLQPRDELETAGVGLAIVRKLALQKNGNVWLDSTPGQGASFHVCLQVDWPRDQKEGS